MAQGLSDLGVGKDMKATIETFGKYVASVLPFMESQKSQSEQAMVDFMKKEASKGVLVFQPQLSNPLHDRAKKMAMPDEVREKILAAKGKRKINL